MILDYRYVAGLFDGEGWFELNRASGKKWRMKREYAFFSRAGLQMREAAIIYSLQETFGGKVYISTPKSKKHSTTYRWCIFGNDCVEFANKIKPFLLAKREQADLMIKFQTEKNSNGNKPTPDERYILYQECYDKMKSLNKRGIGKELILKGE